MIKKKLREIKQLEEDLEQTKNKSRITSFGYKKSITDKCIEKPIFKRSLRKNKENYSKNVPLESTLQNTLDGENELFAENSIDLQHKLRLYRNNSQPDILEPSETKISGQNTILPNLKRSFRPQSALEPTPTLLSTLTSRPHLRPPHHSKHPISKPPSANPSLRPVTARPTSNGFFSRPNLPVSLPLITLPIVPQGIQPKNWQFQHCAQ